MTLHLTTLQYLEYWDTVVLPLMPLMEYYSSSIDCVSVSQAAASTAGEGLFRLQPLNSSGTPTSVPSAGTSVMLLPP